MLKLLILTYLFYQIDGKAVDFLFENSLIQADSLEKHGHSLEEIHGHSLEKHGHSLEIHELEKRKASFEEKHGHSMKSGEMLDKQDIVSDTNAVFLLEYSAPKFKF